MMVLTTIDGKLVRCSWHVPPVGSAREDPRMLDSTDIHLRTPRNSPDELDNMAEEREVWASPLDPTPDKQLKMPCWLNKTRQF